MLHTPRLRLTHAKVHLAHAQGHLARAQGWLARGKARFALTQGAADTRQTGAGTCRNLRSHAAERRCTGPRRGSHSPMPSLARAGSRLERRMMLGESVGIQTSGLLDGEHSYDVFMFTEHFANDPDCFSAARYNDDTMKGQPEVEKAMLDSMATFPSIPR